MKNYLQQTCWAKVDVFYVNKKGSYKLITDPQIKIGKELKEIVYKVRLQQVKKEKQIQGMQSKSTFDSIFAYPVR